MNSPGPSDRAVSRKTRPMKCPVTRRQTDIRRSRVPRRAVASAVECDPTVSDDLEKSHRECPTRLLREPDGSVSADQIDAPEPRPTRWSGEDRLRRLLARERGRDVVSRLSPPHRAFHRAGLTGHPACARRLKRSRDRMVSVGGSARETVDHLFRRRGVRSRARYFTLIAIACITAGPGCARSSTTSSGPLGRD
jgi:hypothetical protein